MFCANSVTAPGKCFFSSPHHESKFHSLFFPGQLSSPHAMALLPALGGQAPGTDWAHSVLPRARFKLDKARGHSQSVLPVALVLPETCS